jgi:hypothetical protein
MEKIKSLLSGHSHDEKTDTSSSTNLGEGSHFGNTHDTTTSGITGNQTSGTTGRYGATSGESTDQTGHHLPTDDLSSGQHSGNFAGQGSHLSSATGTTSTIPGNQTSAAISGTSGSTGQHNLARDAAVTAAGGAGAAQHEHRKNENFDSAPNTGYPGINQDARELGPGIGNPSTTHGSGKELGGPAAAGVTPGFAGGARERDFPLDSNTGNTATSTTQGSNTGHHLGRDAAAVGTAAAVGEGVHHHRENEQGLGSNTAGFTNTTGTSGTTGHPQQVQGPHSTNTANLLDPRVNTTGHGHEDAHHHSARHGGGAEEADQHHNSSTTGSSGHHLGRDAALGAGAGGLTYEADQHHKHDKDLTQAERDAKREHKHELKEERREHHYGRDAAVAGGVGGAAYETNKHLHSSGTRNPNELGEPNASAITGQPSTTTQAQSSNIETKADPTAQSSSSKDHHYGRDAAVAGGVGGAAYEANKHLHSNNARNPTEPREPGTSAITGQPSTTTQAQSSNIGTRADPTAQNSSSKDHHYGRDATLAGGAGAVAYEADKHHKHDKDLSQLEKEAKKEHKREEKEAKKEHKHEEKEEKKGGFLSFLHRDKSKKYTPEEEAEFDRQEHEHNSSHAGRNAALGAGAVGVGGAAYEAERHHADTHKPLPNAPGNHGIGTGAGPQNDLANDGITHGTPLPEKPFGQDLGDHLHGARNRGVQGHSGFPGTAGFGDKGHVGRDAALGAGTVGATGYGIHEHDKHNTGTGPQNIVSEATTDQKGHALPTGNNLTDSAVGGTTSGSHHLGRNTAIGAGVGATAGGVAHHEHRKHDSGYQGGLDDKNTSTGAHGNTTSIGSGLTGNQQTGSGHHTGRDDAAVGGAGLVGEHEYRKHEGASGLGTTTQQSGYPGSNTQSGYTGSNNSATQAGSGYPGSNTQSGYSDNTTSSGGTKVIEGSDGRNKLHKDPPAGYAASGTNAGETHIPSSGAARENNINRDTGTANAGTEY